MNVDEIINNYIIINLENQIIYFIIENMFLAICFWNFTGNRRKVSNAKCVCPHARDRSRVCVCTRASKRASERTSKRPSGLANGWTDVRTKGSAWSRINRAYNRCAPVDVCIWKPSAWSPSRTQLSLPASLPPALFTSIPPCLSLTNGAGHGNANFCAGRVVVLTRRKTSNGELTFSFVPRALSSASGGDDIFPKVAALNFTVDGCRSLSRWREHERCLALAKFNCRALL